MTEQTNKTESMHDAAFTFASLDVAAAMHAKIAPTGEVTQVDWRGIARAIEKSTPGDKGEARQKVEGVVGVLRRFNDDNAVNPFTIDGLSVMRDLSFTLLYGGHLAENGTLKTGVEKDVLQDLAERRNRTVAEVRDEVGQARIFLTLAAGAMRHRQEHAVYTQAPRMVVSAAQ